MAKEIKSANATFEKAIKKPLKQKGTPNTKNISVLKSTGLNKKEILHSLRLMLLARGIDNKAMNLLKQGRTFFHIAGSGHEAIQTAVGKAIDPNNDWLFPYYRDLAVVLTAGVTPADFFLECFAKADDPSSGSRQLPCHWGAKKINLPSQSSATGTQFLHAVGVALSLKRQNKNNFAYVSSGEGTTSQGEFHEAVNWASREKLPVLFLIENNK
ncbi:MAG: tungsten formylmethanofuran dehydrogenase, partial [Bacteroidetes bacterium]|nr:tungsten formylmethanofuran dehydrogenase [Bacteroidota bacterium]